MNNALIMQEAAGGRQFNVGRDPTITISIIVNTYNNAAYLNDAILAIGGLDYPVFELIIVNGPSTDNSQYIINHWGDRIKALQCPNVNLAQSRNIGIAAAAGDIICFLDDYAAPHPQWLRRLEKVYGDPQIVGVGGFTIDNSGTRWQSQKTLYDRMGNAYKVNSYFDERPLNRPGTPFFPSLLGTNSSFRATALRAVGGFDETFAYMLDETDLCLRLIDDGGRIVYEPSALVYHQFLPDHIRTNDHLPLTFCPLAMSKAYFSARHDGRKDGSKTHVELAPHRQYHNSTNQPHVQDQKINAARRSELDEDVIRGIDHGRMVAKDRMDRTGGDLLPGNASPFLPFFRSKGIRIALISQGFPPSNETGIARWTSMVAQGLVARGHDVHVLTKALGTEETISFTEGMWIHRLIPDEDNAVRYAGQFNVPGSLMQWNARVVQEVQYIKSFGLDIASFPIWDLEGIGLMDDPDIPTIVSLHTTFAMTKPFKPEWNIRALFEYHFVDRVIAAERALLGNAPLLLANSRAIIDAIGDHYDLDIEGRSIIVPHGTLDPLQTRADAAAERDKRAMDPAEPLQLLYVGRFEDRKGIDIALDVACCLASHSNVVMRFVGDTLSDERLASLKVKGIAEAIRDGRIEFLGKVDRNALDDVYVAHNVILMPSRFESFGLVAIEAMAAGCTVVALAAGGLSEVATPENGCRAFAESDDVADRMAYEILALAGDRIELRARSRQARAAFEAHFTTKQMAAELEQVYKIALARHANRPARQVKDMTNGD